MGELIDIASDVRLKERYPLDYEDKGLIRGTHNACTSWASGNSTDTENPRGNAAKAAEFIKKTGLDKFYHGVGSAGADPEFRAWVDWSEVWDKWPGQYDPFMSAVETWHAGSAPYREFPAQKIAPRLRGKSCMTRYDCNHQLPAGNA